MGEHGAYRGTEETAIAVQEASHARRFREQKARRLYWRAVAVGQHCRCDGCLIGGFAQLRDFFAGARRSTASREV